MRHRLVLALAATTLLVTPACLPAGVPLAPVSARVPRASAAPSVAPSAAVASMGSPSSIPSASTAPVAAVPSRLQAPAGLKGLRGTVRIDAAYAVQAGVGRLDGAGAAQTVVVAPAALVAAGGLNLTAPDAAAIISQNGGTILSHNGSQLVAAGGGNLVAAGGGNLVAAGGGNLVAAGGGNVISQNGGTYRLAQAAAVDGQLPAAGMVVGLLDMATGQLVPVGLEADGKPAYGTYTDAAGAFEVYPPAALTGNFTVVAVPPSAKADPRLAYGLVAPAGSAEVAMDEDSAIATRVIREAFATRLMNMLVADDPAKETNEMLGGGGIAELLTPSFVSLNRVAREVGLREAAAAEREASARRMCDMMLATVALAGMTVRIEQADDSFAEPVLVLDAIIEVFKDLRNAADAKLVTDPGFFERQAYLAEFNATRPAADPIRIRKGADLCTFLVEAYIKATRPTYGEISTLYRSLALGKNGKGAYNSHAEVIDNCGQLIATAMVGVLVSDDGATTARMEAALRERPRP